MRKYIVSYHIPGQPWYVIGVAETGKQLLDMTKRHLLNSRPPWSISARYINGSPVVTNTSTGAEVSLIPVLP